MLSTSSALNESDKKQRSLIIKWRKRLEDKEKTLKNKEKKLKEIYHRLLDKMKDDIQSVENTYNNITKTNIQIKNQLTI